MNSPVRKSTMTIAGCRSAKGSLLVRLPANLRHRLHRLDEARLVDEVALLLAPDGGFDDAPKMIVRRSRAEKVPQRGLLQREQAGSQSALGGEANPVAGAAESLTD